MARCRERVIYGLIDGDTMELRYIGQTVDRVGRLATHKKAGNRNTHLNRWLRKTHWNMIILERDPPDLNEAEMCWIHDMREQGARLLNHTDGGGGTVGWNHSLKVRAKIGDAKRGEHNPAKRPEVRAKNSAAHRGNLNSWFGKKRNHSPETRTKIGAARRGRKLSIDTRAKISAALRGKPKPPRSPEHRANISAALSGKPRSVETRAKISAANRGDKNPAKRPEVRARISAALRARWALRKENGA